MIGYGLLKTPVSMRRMAAMGTQLAGDCNFCAFGPIPAKTE